MKVKYKMIRDLLFYEDECIAYLEEMASKGWFLIKVGDMFFKFEKREPRNIKYQMDYNVLTEEYLEVITFAGYHFIDNCREISFFYNEDIDAKDLHTDESTRLMVLSNMYKYSTGLSIIGLSLVVMMLVSYMWDSTLLTVRYTLGSFFINANLFLGNVFWFCYTGSFVIEGLLIVLFKLSINRQKENKKPLNKLIKWLYMVDRIVVIILLLIFSLIAINQIPYNPVILIVFVVTIIIYQLFNRYLSKIIYRENDEKKRKIKTTIAMGVLFSFMLIMQNVDFIQNNNIIPPYQDGTNVESTANESILVSNYKSTLYKKEQLIFIEDTYKCLNRNIANAVFEELICDIEHDTRIPSVEEIRAIVDVKGEWSVNEIEYIDYKQAITKFELIETKYADKCYYLDNSFVAVKDKSVLLVVKKDNVNIDDILKYYLT